MKLLVTGGMGFMGSNFIRHICNTYPSYRIVNFDALTYAGNPDNLEDLEAAEFASPPRQRRYAFVRGDIADREALAAAVERESPDAIVNFAAESHVDRSLVDAGAFMRSNVIGVYNLLELAKKYNIKFLQISTDEIYGDVPRGVSTEESPLVPTNPYAASKAAADLLVQSYWRTHKTPVLTVRGSNNFGPYQYPEKIIPLAITNMLEGGKVPVHGTVDHVRTWIHVTDFANGVDRVLHEAQPGSIYNIAGREQSKMSILRTIAGHFGLSDDRAFEYVPDRLGPDYRYAPHAGKIERELGWKPKRRLEEALPDLIEWYKTNVHWWRKLKEKSSFLEHYEKQRLARYY